MEGFYNVVEKMAIITPVAAGLTVCAYSSRKKRLASIKSDKMLQKKRDNCPSYPETNDSKVKEFCNKVSAQHTVVVDLRADHLGVRIRQGSEAQPLVHDKANKLVGLFHNLRITVRMKKYVYAEPAVGWEEDDKPVGETSGIVKFGLADM
ncbi:MAG: hypothetical protein SGPRY_002447 [Prymnesium sp.]